MDKYTRQQGLVAQEIVADANLVVYGTGPALPYLLQCLALMGAATRHGHIYLHLDDRPVTAADLAGQFLLEKADLEKPIAEMLVDRITQIDNAVDVCLAQRIPSGLGVAVPSAVELPRIRDHASISAWGQVLPTSVYIGPAPVRMQDTDGNVLTAALAAVCGAMLAQAALGQLGAIIDGPTVLSSWLEERLWVSHPGIGRHARTAQAEGAPSPGLRGVLESIDSTEEAARFRLLVDGQVVDPRVTTVVDEDTVVVTIPMNHTSAWGPRAIVRPRLMPPPQLRPMLWSPLVGPTLDGDRVVGGEVVLAERLPPSRIVLCGVGALGSWASAVIAASGFPEVDLCVVDMDDAVEHHNLNRQVLFRSSDIGLPKASRAAERLQAINPRMRMEALSVMVSPEILDDLVGGTVAYEISDDALHHSWSTYQAKIGSLAKALTHATAILSCPDNHQTRWTLNVVAERLGVPLVNGAIDGFVGRAHLCDPADRGRCLVCWLGESIAHEPERRSCTDLFEVAPVPSIVTSAAVVGAAQAAIMVAQIAGPAGKMRRFHTFDGVSGTLEGYRAADRDPEECPAHLLGSRVPSVIDRQLPARQEGF